MTSDYLVHHGIKGQQWGVRRGPPYPIETGMKAGTKLSSVGLVRVINGQTYVTPKDKMLYTYNPDDDWDSKVYKGPFSVYSLQRGGTYTQNFMAEFKYQTVKDLEMPTRKEREEEFRNLVSDKKYSKELAKELKNTAKTLDDYDYLYASTGRRPRQTNFSKILTDSEVFKEAYEVFNHMMEAWSRYDTTKHYVEVMSNKYDAMVDDNNQSVYNNAHDPVIIFKVQECLKQIGADAITFKEISDNYDEVEEVLKKEGKRVKL